MDYILVPLWQGCIPPKYTFNIVSAQDILLPEGYKGKYFPPSGYHSDQSVIVLLHTSNHIIIPKRVYQYYCYACCTQYSCIQHRQQTITQIGEVDALLIRNLLAIAQSTTWQVQLASQPSSRSWSTQSSQRSLSSPYMSLLLLSDCFVHWELAMIHSRPKRASNLHCWFVYWDGRLGARRTGDRCYSTVARNVNRTRTRVGLLS